MIDIKPSQRNTNKHTKDGMDLLENSINKVGVIIEIHLKENEYPVIVTDIENNSKEYFEAQILANTTANKNFDLDIEMIEVIAEEFDIDIEEIGVEVVEVEDDTILEAQEDDFDATPPTVPKTVLGDLYEIGEHRLLCGDSTCSDTVAKLMDGNKADMVFTDPPYNVDYGANGNPRHKQRTIKNDKMGVDDWNQFVIGYMNSIFQMTDGNIYISMSDKELGHMQSTFRECGGKWASFIVWVKDRLVLSPKDYHSRHETILYGWKEGVKDRLRVLDRTQDDVWEIKRPGNSEEHPTMKPIALMERAINNSSKVGWIVGDLFLGSGSTMVASHQLKRKCYGMELDCKYVDVIVKRMLKLDKTLKIKKNGIDETETWLKLIE